jgi:hypothetical protein
MNKHVIVVLIVFAIGIVSVQAVPHDSMIGISVAPFKSLSTYDFDGETHVLDFDGFLFGIEHYRSFEQRPFFGLRSSAAFGFPIDGGIIQADTFTINGESWGTQYRTLSEADFLFFFRATVGPSLRLINLRWWQLRVAPLLGTELVHIKWPSVPETNSVLSKNYEYDALSITAANVLVSGDVISTFRIMEQIAIFIGLEFGVHAYTHLRFESSGSIDNYSGPTGGGYASGVARIYLGAGYQY